MAINDMIPPDSPLARLLGVPRSEQPPVQPKPLSTKVQSQLRPVTPQHVPARLAAKPVRGGAEVSSGALTASASALVHDTDDIIGMAVDGPVLDIVDLAGVNPGPAVDDVPFGNTCGSCSKYLAINDPRRDDPEFMDRYLASSRKCPACLPEINLMKAKTKTLSEVVQRADSAACSKFAYNRARASNDFVDIMDRIARLTRGELEVIAVSMDDLRRMKQVEERFGYRIGDMVPVRLQGRADAKGKVVGIDVGKRKLLLETMINGRPRHVSMSIPEAVEIDI